MSKEVSISHEVRSCLNALRLNAHALMLAEAREDALECLEGLELGADKMITLMDKLDAIAATGGLGPSTPPAAATAPSYY